MSRLEPAVPHVRELLRRTKVLLVPSLWREAFGLIALEAALSGIPVLSTDHGGLVEANPLLAAQLAVDGARACAAQFPRLRFLDLGLSPLAPVPSGMDWNPLVVCGEEDCAVEPRRAPFVDALFAGLFRWGTGLSVTIV